MIVYYNTISFQDFDRCFPMFHTSWILLCVHGIYPTKFIRGKYCIRSPFKQYFYMNSCKYKEVSTISKISQRS